MKNKCSLPLVTEPQDDNHCVFIEREAIDWLNDNLSDGYGLSDIDHGGQLVLSHTVCDGDGESHSYYQRVSPDLEDIKTKLAEIHERKMRDELLGRAQWADSYIRKTKALKVNPNGRPSDNQ